MANLISTSLPSLLHGMSQQPYNVRQATQCEDMRNCWPNPLRGVDKRFPSKWINRLRDDSASSFDFDAFIHTFKDGISGDIFAVVIEDSAIRVFDANTGEEKTVNTPDGVSYINTGPSEKAWQVFRAITIADYTFIVNSTKVVEKDSNTSPARANEAYVECRQGAYGLEYSIFISDGSNDYTATVTTPDGTTASDVYDVDTTEILIDLQTELETTPGEGGNWNFAGAAYGIIQITNSADPISIRTRDGLGGASLKATTGIVQRFSDLPQKAANDYVVKVEGDASSNFDDYYVKSVTLGSAWIGDVYWQETIGWDLETDFDADTMPFVLINNQDGTFTFEQASWNSRLVGDDSSNPFPTFIGRTINDVFFYKNRLGFLSDENVIMSRAGDFFNFFRESALSLLDSDPIDVAVSSSEVSILRKAVPFGGRMILFSERGQFEFVFGETLSPSTAAINKRTSFKSDVGTPIATGKTILFGAQAGTVSSVQEYYIQSEEVHDAIEVSEHVPELIEGSIRTLAVDPVQQALFVLTDDRPNKIYLYRYHWGTAGEQQVNTKLLSSWSYWEFPTNTRIIDIHVQDNYLYMFQIDENDDLVLERFFIAPSNTHDENSDFEIYLDKWLDLRDANDIIDGFTTVYNGGADETTITLPYDVDEDGRTLKLIRVHKPGFEGSQPAGDDVTGVLTQTSPNTFTASGDFVSSDFYRIGFQFETFFEFSPPVIRETTASGDRVAVTEGRLQLLRWRVNYGNTAYTQLKITPFDRAARIYEYRSPLTSSPAATGGLREGTIVGTCRMKNNEGSIRLINDRWWPSSWINAEFEATFYIRSDRL